MKSKLRKEMLHIFADNANFYLTLLR